MDDLYRCGSEVASQAVSSVACADPFPVVIWNPFELPKPEPAFRSLKPGLVYVNFDPVLSGIERPVDDPVEYDQV